MDNVKTILAKYWVAIVCGVIALIAIGMSFVPLGEWHEAQLQDMKTSAASYDTADHLLSKPRKKPPMPGQAEGEPLKQFPSPAVIKSGEDLKEKLNKESANAVNVVVQLNTHKPLLPGILPQGSAPLDYRAAYVQRLGTNGSLYKTVLQAGLPPTSDEVKLEGERLWKTKFEPQLVMDGQGKAFNEDSVKAQYSAELLLLPARMRQDRARMCKLYAGADALPIDPVVSNLSGLPPDPRKIWWSQLELWITEDVCQSLADANKPAADVSTSAVKRLLKLEIPGPDQAMIFTGNRSAAGAASAVDPSAPAVLPEVNSPVPLDYKITPSGRVSCAMYDVVQFRLEMVVTAKDIPWILDCLVRNKLISVLNVESIVAEDVTSAEKNGFFYGQQPVVRMSVRCEALFLREWTKDLMPEAIKRMLIVMTAGT